MAKKVNNEMSKVVVSKIYESKFQKAGTLTAELRQVHTQNTSYTTTTSEFEDSIFNTEELGSTEYTNSDTRVYFMTVPAGTTVESLTQKLSGYPNATLYRILASEPILSEKDNYAITNGLTTKDIIGKAQEVQYPLGHPKAGEPVLHNGKIQYKRIGFATEFKEDIDNR